MKIIPKIGFTFRGFKKINRLGGRGKMRKLHYVLLFLACIAFLMFSAGCGGAGGGSTATGTSELVSYKGVNPQVSVNRGVVPFKLIGDGRGINLSDFRGEPSISLEGNETTIPGVDVSVNSGELTCSFDISGRPAGVYDIVVTDGRATQRLSRGFSLRNSIQAAIIMAASLYDGTALVDAYVPAGTYDTSSETFPIVLLDGVNLKGPGAGLLTNPSGQRGANAILDAEGTERVIEISQYTNFWGITGLEIRNGSTGGDGAGIHWFSIVEETTSGRNNKQYSYSSPLITDCYIHDNLSGGNGGGVFIRNGQSDIPETTPSTLDLTYNIVSNNISSGGYGAGTCLILENHSFTTNVNNNEFSENEFTNTGAYGGGLYYYSSAYNHDYYHGTTNINNNTFTANVCQGGYGGGAYIDEMEHHLDLTMDGNTFNNHSDLNQGGGCYLYGVRYNGICQFQNNTFTNNSTNYEVAGFNDVNKGSGQRDGPSNCGGGLYIYDIYSSSRQFFEYNTFSNNYACNNGGGVYIYTLDNCQFNMTGNNFTNNTADDAGGGLSIKNTYDTQSDTYHRNTFTGNQAAVYGGGFYYYENIGGFTAISDNTFSGNTATDYAGGLFFGYAHNVTSITGNTFTGNTGGAAGGMYFSEQDYGQFLISNNLFTGNSAADSGGGAYFGYLYTYGTTIALNKIYGNNASTNGGGVYIRSIGGAGGDLILGGSPEYQNDIYGNTSPDTNQGTQLYNNSIIHVNAQFNYWGGGAPTNPGDVFGDVDTSNFATSPLL